MIVTLIEYRDRKQVDGNTLEVYSKADSVGGQYRSLIRFVNPPRDTNKLMLKNGNDLWFFDPASKASIRLSPQQRLLGQAANGDVVTVNLAKDYSAELVGEEDIADGERQSRHCYKLRLVERSADVTYNHIEIWIEVSSARPIKALFYTESDRLLKTAYYRKFQPQLGNERPTEVVIIDGLDPSWVTVMRYSEYAWRDVPDCMVATRLSAPIQARVKMRQIAIAAGLALLVAGPAMAADAPGDAPSDADALSLADEAPTVKPASQSWRLFGEGALARRGCATRLDPATRAARRSTFAMTARSCLSCVPCFPTAST